MADRLPWYRTDAAPAEGGPLWTWTRVNAVDVAGETIGHSWADVEGMALDLGLMVRLPNVVGGLITLVPWHQVAWVRWSPRDTPNGD